MERAAGKLSLRRIGCIARATVAVCADKRLTELRAVRLSIHYGWLSILALVCSEESCFLTKRKKWLKLFLYVRSSCFPY